MKTPNKFAIVAVLCLMLLVSAGPAVVSAEPPNPYFSIETVTLDDGTQLERMTISGPPKPPPGFESERAPVELSAISRAEGAASLPVPTYDWVFGCSAVSASMIGAYYDRNGLPNIYTGPTDGGVMPMNNSVWPTWFDSIGESYPGNPLTASRNGSDGRTIKGSIDDYWVSYGSSAADPYITSGWTEHTWGSAIGDYMWTSQSDHGNTDGATTFWGYGDATKLTCASLQAWGYPDGTLGRKLFYEARGYSIPGTECYNQKIDTIPGGFSFAQYKAKIDAGYPVFLNLAGHSVVGVAYSDPATVYINDTWDYDTHSMTWGGSYSGMQMLSVSVADPVIGPVSANFTVSLSFAAPGAVSVNWATADGTATAASGDYAAASGAVSFATGESSKTVTVQVNGDAVVESNESFTVNLTNPSGATLADGQGVGTIVNDDQPPAAVHVGDLDRSRSIQKKTNTWTANVTVTVHDASHKVVSSAAVTGAWSVGGSSTCTTGSRGTCTLVKSGIPSGTASVTLSVTGIVKTGYQYDSVSNHEPDTNDESNGTTIIIRK
jgi:hypothetical protein